MKAKYSSKNNPRSIWDEEKEYIEKYELNGKVYMLIKSKAYKEPHELSNFNQHKRGWNYGSN